MNVIDRIKQRTTPEQKAFVKKNLSIVHQITELIKANDWTQKEFAQKLGKNESEVSKWLTGMHNISLKSIAKMEAVLKADIITTPIEACEKYKSIEYVTFKVHARTNKSPFSFIESDKNNGSFNKTTKSLAS